MSSGITITQVDDGFDVEVAQGSVTTSHRVRVPTKMVDDLGLASVDHAELVRQSIAFLLEREPATSILPEFGLDVIARYFPEYPDELVKRVGAGG